MKKFYFISLVAALLMAVPANAQLPVFNHLGADLGIGTTGIAVDVSTTLTNWCQMRVGLDIMPGFHFNTSMDANVTYRQNGVPETDTYDVDLRASLNRVQGHILFNGYPFGAANSFFITAGGYFGGKSLVKLKGHSADIAALQASGALESGYIDIGDYELQFEDGGNIYGGLCAWNFRPYLGLGYGRPVPGKRLGFMFELGVQFMGKMKVCQGQKLTPIDISNISNDDTWQKWMNKLTVYPVLKFTLTGKIF